jgi:copper homeostasis protein
MNIVKEVCVESFSEAVRAVKAGATRIELCENLYVGGATPSKGTIKTCAAKLNVPIMVMIRPRGGNFVYSSEEFEIMKEDIAACKEIGVDGVVFGMLDSDNELDEVNTRELVTLARPLQVTFHKAIDDISDIVNATKKLKEIGVDRILSSGGADTAMQGKENLSKMLEIAGSSMKIVVAGKVTFENFEEIKSVIPSTEFHGRRLVDFL